MRAHVALWLGCGWSRCRDEVGRINVGLFPCVSRQLGGERSGACSWLSSYTCAEEWSQSADVALGPQCESVPRVLLARPC